MTVRRPKHPQSHPNYQRDFEDAVWPAFKSLIIVAISAGWAPATVAKGLLALARMQVQDVADHIDSEKQMHLKPPVQAVPVEPSLVPKIDQMRAMPNSE